MRERHLRSQAAKKQQECAAPKVPRGKDATRMCGISGPTRLSAHKEGQCAEIQQSVTAVAHSICFRSHVILNAWRTEACGQNPLLCSTSMFKALYTHPFTYADELSTCTLLQMRASLNKTKHTIAHQVRQSACMDMLGVRRLMSKKKAFMNWAYDFECSRVAMGSLSTPSSSKRMSTGVLAATHMLAQEYMHTDHTHAGQQTATNMLARVITWFHTPDQDTHAKRMCIHKSAQAHAHMRTHICTCSHTHSCSHALHVHAHKHMRACSHSSSLASAARMRTLRHPSMRTLPHPSMRTLRHPPMRT